jgi:hypothetical protein
VCSLTGTQGSNPCPSAIMYNYSVIRGLHTISTQISEIVITVYYNRLIPFYRVL